jgi:hypothetical protein
MKKLSPAHRAIIELADLAAMLLRVPVAKDRSNVITRSYLLLARSCCAGAPPVGLDSEEQAGVGCRR